MCVQFFCFTLLYAGFVRDASRRVRVRHEPRRHTLRPVLFGFLPRVADFCTHRDASSGSLGIFCSVFVVRADM